jgi:hypothetical protein
MSDLLTRFSQKYPPEGAPSLPGPEIGLVDDELLQELWRRFNGCRLGNGLFQLFTPKSAEEWKETLRAIWPEFPFLGLCFGANSLGQIFVAEPEFAGGPLSQVCFFDPVEGKVFVISDTMLEFIEQTLSPSEKDNEVFLPLFFHEWLSDGNPAPQYGECLGYIRPLFLGGEDVNDNMEVIDMDVHWTVTGGIIQKIRAAG